MKERQYKQLPSGGKRAKMGTGRARSALMAVRLRPADEALLDALAAQYGVTRTVIIERALHLLAAQGTGADAKSLE